MQRKKSVGRRRTAASARAGPARAARKKPAAARAKRTPGARTKKPARSRAKRPAAARAKRPAGARAKKRAAGRGAAGAKRPSYESRNLQQADDDLRSLAKVVGASSRVLDAAHDIYNMVLEKKIVRGRSISVLAASAFYAACRNLEVPKTLKDIQHGIIEATGKELTRKDISRCYRLILRELDLSVPIVEPASCVGRIAKKAKISDKIRRDAVMLLKRSSASRQTAGKDPMGLAAAALYAASVANGDHKTQKDIAVAADVTEVTIRNRYKGLRTLA